MATGDERGDVVATIQSPLLKMFVLAAALNGTSDVGKNERVFTGSVDNWSTNYGTA